MNNPHCECDGPGFCKRHQIDKGEREFELCSGEADSIDCGKKYWLAWEQGKLGATAPANPVLNPQGFCSGRPIGLGSKVSSGIKSLTGIKPCGGCKNRAALLNSIAPADLPPVQPVEFVEPVKRNCTMHIWPVKGHDAWRWNCDQLMKHAELFNGRRIVAIATSREAEEPNAVREHMKDFTDEFIVVKNSRRLREVASWQMMLESLESLEPNEVTFSCHSKCVRHKIDLNDPGSTVVRWTKAMYDVCLSNWDLVAEALHDKGMAGAFKRYGQFTTIGNNRWHYSGTFYWWRNRDVFQRNWRRIDKKFFGTESWPGHVFKAGETACLFGDDVGDLYNLDYWKARIQPQLDEWMQKHGIAIPQ